MTPRDFWSMYVWDRVLLLPVAAVFIWKGWWAGLAVYAIIVVLIFAFFLARRDRETEGEND